MKELTTEEIKKEALAILCDVHEFCINNKIKYFLDCGTLLGAVRHKGYIPWDDDIDICMLRPDYERFLAEYKSENYRLVNYTNQEKWALSYTKVCDKTTCSFLPTGEPLSFDFGIDIFVKDAVPEDKEEYTKYIESQNKLFDTLCKIQLYELDSSKGIKHFIKKVICLFITSNSIAEKLHKRSSRISLQNTNHVGVTTCLYLREREFINKSCYESTLVVPFEDKEFCIPVGYKEVLLNEFGPDYMTPPPEDKRYSTHTEKYYWKD